MDEAAFGVKPGAYIPGTVVHAYLQAYALKFGVAEKIWFDSKVTAVERKNDGRWRLTIENGSGNGKGHILTHKLVVATGLTSEPFLPEMKGASTFRAPFFHSKDFWKHADILKSARDIVVFGGHKSAWDVSYAAAAAGARVTMVIRKSGRGPNWMTHSQLTLKRSLTALAHTRLFTWFSPCIWGDADGYSLIRKLLHGTAVGRWLVRAFWGLLRWKITRRTGYDNHPESKKLKPWTDPFWSAVSLGILNYPSDFFQFVRDGGIKVHIADITHLSARTVHLSDGSELEADALVCCTGWKYRPPMDFLPASTNSDAALGFPHRSSEVDDPLARAADAEILTRFPRLQNPPVQNPPSNGAPNRPWRLYRFMVPPAYIPDKSIAFAGALASLMVPTCAEIQALWIAAYFTGKLDVEALSTAPAPRGIFSSSWTPGDRIYWDTIVNSQFGKWRCPAGNGQYYPDFIFDAVPYFDTLLKDLGLSTHRKKNRWAEWTQPYGPRDYKGLVEEWKGREKRWGWRIRSVG
jgi:hypothetical protein